MASLRDYQRDFVRKVNRAGRDIPARVSSYWRSAAQNRRVGGQPDSLHLYGLAIDVVPTRAHWQETITRARREGLVVIDEGDHLHLQYFAKGRRPGFLA